LNFCLAQNWEQTPILRTAGLVIAAGSRVKQDEGRIAMRPQQVLFGRNLAKFLVARRIDKRAMAMAFDQACR
jgi:hypothetical protein